jgi:hypothetical protein
MQGLDAWAALYGQPAPRRGFRRERLPAPVEYYPAQGLSLSGHGEWRSALCPFHADTRPSLRVDIETGAFRCMACGAKGQDVLAFHRQRHGLGFVAAAQALGCWEGAR